MTPSRELTAAPRPPGIVRRWFAAHPNVIDRGIAFCYLFGSLLMSLIGWTERLWTAEHEGTLESTPTGWIIAHEIITTAIVFVVLWRRRKQPLLGFVLTAVVLLISWPDTSYQFLADGTALLFMMYAVPVYDSVRNGWIAFAIAAGTELLNATGWITLSFPIKEGWGGLWVGALLTHLIALLIGINIGNRRRYVDALVDRAAMLERDREQLARIAVGKERERIAREMHDIVAHSLSVMIALGEGAARTVRTSPDRAADAMERSAETGRSALAEMRRLLGVLTDPEQVSQVEFAPQPDSTNLAALVEDIRGAGVHVTISTTGTPPVDSGLELAIYRIVQESLTNVLRYAGVGAHATVTLSYSPTHTHVSIRDTGPVTAGSTTMDSLGSGNGIAGLKERARMFGGTLTAGPHPQGGWLVEATLPTKGTQ